MNPGLIAFLVHLLENSPAVITDVQAAIEHAKTAPDLIHEVDGALHDAAKALADLVA